MVISHACSNCHSKVRSKKREFTDQAWTVLFAWGEVPQDAVDAPVCDDCYIELRDILIDRASEVEAALKNPDALRKMVEAAKQPRVITPVKKVAAAVSKPSTPAKSVPVAKSNTTKGKAVAKVTKGKAVAAASKKARKPSRMAS